MLQFVRQIPISIVIEKAPAEKWGFLFYLAAGFTKELNPLSGMTVSLPLVDQALQELKVNLEVEILTLRTDNMNELFSELLEKIKAVLN